MSSPHITRREFVTRAGAAGLAIPFASAIVDPFQTVPSPAGTRKVVIFSKCLQWLNYEDLASFVADCGFDGVDLTVRPGGHVEPANVERDLPRAVEALQKKNLPVLMITTAIEHADDPHASAVLQTAGKLGIPVYRMGWYSYQQGKNLDENLADYKDSLTALARMNGKYKIKGGYQNHSGINFGSAVWDIGKVLHEVNSDWLGMQYDVRHATTEGAHAWIRGFEYVRPYINSLDIKDFYWGKENGKWTDVNVPLGQGMVDFDKYFDLIRPLPDSIALSVHAEYELGGAQEGHTQISISADEIRNKLTGDLAFIRQHL